MWKLRPKAKTLTHQSLGQAQGLEPIFKPTSVILINLAVTELENN